MLVADFRETIGSWSLILKDSVNSLLCITMYDVPYFEAIFCSFAFKFDAALYATATLKGVSPILMSEVPTWVLIGLKIRNENVTWHRPRFPGVQLEFAPQACKTKLISDQRKLFKPSRTACLLQIHSCPVTLCLVRFPTYPHNLGPPPWWPDQ